jgi:hypothetical protein
VLQTATQAGAQASRQVFIKVTSHRPCTKERGKGNYQRSNSKGYRRPPRKPAQQQGTGKPPVAKRKPEQQQGTGKQRPAKRKKK